MEQNNAIAKIIASITGETVIVDSTPTDGQSIRPSDKVPLYLKEILEPYIVTSYGGNHYKSVMTYSIPETLHPDLQVHSYSLDSEGDVIVAAVGYRSSSSITYFCIYDDAQGNPYPTGDGVETIHMACLCYSFNSKTFKLKDIAYTRYMSGGITYWSAFRVVRTFPNSGTVTILGATGATTFSWVEWCYFSGVTMRDYNILTSTFAPAETVQGGTSMTVPLTGTYRRLVGTVVIPATNTSLMPIKGQSIGVVVGNYGSYDGYTKITSISGLQPDIWKSA